MKKMMMGLVLMISMNAMADSAKGVAASEDCLKRSITLASLLNMIDANQNLDDVQLLEKRDEATASQVSGLKSIATSVCSENTANEEQKNLCISDILDQRTLEIISEYDLQSLEEKASCATVLGK